MSKRDEVVRDIEAYFKCGEKFAKVAYKTYMGREWKDRWKDVCPLCGKSVKEEQC